ncbi:hypothetical protein EW145_g5022 [Phellinidium pouzarii]|uniref:Fork-head domain-containing protein n=1 Tax=Phellinidium pouzarii TaxID=167371 RepID=A0A4S4L1F5_9AGAM|nr:hypothetical protein EW145_g5022 [Phellinidium pouzarii]
MNHDHANHIEGVLDHTMAISPVPNEKADSDEHPDKISAFYSLAFPNFTYYVQTIAVAIGRRSVRPGTPSSSDLPQVDVDLGPLKSVSRLHARIEYEESQEQFVLVVLGRNGAWVDGIWSGSGSRVPLGASTKRLRHEQRSKEQRDRTRKWIRCIYDLTLSSTALYFAICIASREQPGRMLDIVDIQIATRVFNFILPPPPAPEDSPSLSSPSSTTRHLSPSIDITSLSPDSSVQSPSVNAVDLPSAVKVEKAPPEVIKTVKPIPKANGKKRKKPGVDARPPPPEVMPPRPQFTYAQLCYRAITSLTGKATLQEICAWVSDNFDWYRYNEGSGWESSIRHNLSSNRAFKKMERCAGERGKGFFWSVDTRFEHLVKDQEGKGNGEGTKAKGKNAKLLEPPLKRSIKGDLSSPLPPRLGAPVLPMTTSVSPYNTTPLKSPPEQIQSNAVLSSVKFERDTLSLDSPAANLSHLKPEIPSTSSTQQQINSSITLSSRPSAEANANMSTIPSDIVIPIVIGFIPSTNPLETSSKAPSSLDLSSPPIALHHNTIILNPAIFSSLTPDQLKELEALGAKKAIEILQSYIVRFLKEKRKSEGSKSKGKKKNKGLKKKDGKEETVSGAEAGTTSEAGQSQQRPTSTDCAASTNANQAELTLASSSTVSAQLESSAAPDKALSPTSDMIQAVGPLRISTPTKEFLDPSSNEEIDIMGDFDEPISKRRKLDVRQV